MENVLLDRPVSMRDRVAMYNSNALKIGIFGANCSSGRSATKVPERWSASWPDCLRLARMADEAGIDFMLPIARWKGYGGDTDFHGSTLETISDEISVNRLVKPKAHTVALTRGTRLRADISMSPGASIESSVSAPRDERGNTFSQSIEYMRQPGK